MSKMKCRIARRKYSDVPRNPTHDLAKFHLNNSTINFPVSMNLREKIVSLESQVVVAVICWRHTYSE